jgi:LacI family transcriptional regulator
MYRLVVRGSVTKGRQTPFIDTIQINSVQASGVNVAESVSVVDVAARAGVSLGTVSNVLNRPELVAPKTRERVLRAVAELGYVRNEAARQLRSGRSHTIGLLVLDVRNPFFTDVAAGVEDAAASADLSVILCNSADDREREAHYLSLLQEQRSFGILVTPVATRNPLIDEVRARGIAIVLVDRGSSRRQCSVSVNDRVGGELAVAHLMAGGHERVAFVGGPASIKQVSDRLAGARSAARAVARSAGAGEDAIVVVPTPALNVAEGRKAGAVIAEMPGATRPTAVFCANDLLALGVLQEMTRRRMAVPGDIAIVGYDDIDFAAAAAVPLTSVRQPRALLGGTATELLIEEVTRPEGHQHRQVVFEPELIVRDSSAT